jgi:hypothetical protein
MQSHTEIKKGEPMLTQTSRNLNALPSVVKGGINV